MTNWEQMWQEGETPWDKGYAAPPLEELLEMPEWADGAGRRILVPGCGSGHDVRALAARGWRPVGLDVSPQAVKVAREYPPEGGEEYVEEDLFAWVEKRFDALWEHTCFCAIEPGDRGRYARAAARLVKPGGFLAGVFFLTPWDEDETPDPPPYGSTREEILETLHPAFELLWDRVPERVYPGREGREWLAVFRRVNP